jgi:hypothetical protein
VATLGEEPCARANAKARLLDLVNRANRGGDLVDSVDDAAYNGRASSYGGGCNATRPNSSE